MYGAKERKKKANEKTREEGREMRDTTRDGITLHVTYPSLGLAGDAFLA